MGGLSHTIWIGRLPESILSEPWYWNPAYPLGPIPIILSISALSDGSEEGLTEAKRALDLDPVSPAILHYVVGCNFTGEAIRRGELNSVWKNARVGSELYPCTSGARGSVCRKRECTMNP